MSPVPAARFSQGVLLAAAAGAIWGFVFVVPEVLRAFSPIQQSAGRYLLLGALCTVLLLPRLGRVLRALSRRDWMVLVGLSLAGNIFYYIALAEAVKGAGVAATSLIIGILPATIALTGQREASSVRRRGLIIPLALIGLGVVCINADVFAIGRSGLGGGMAGLVGIGAAFAGLLGWTAFAVWNGAHLKNNPQIAIRDWSLLTGMVTGLFALVLAFPAFGPGAVAGSGPQNWPLFWGVCLAVAVGASIIGNSLWSQASRLLPMTLSGPLIVFETLFALTYGFVYAMRWPRPLEWAAMGLMIAGVALVARQHR